MGYQPGDLLIYKNVEARGGPDWRNRLGKVAVVTGHDGVNYRVRFVGEAEEWRFYNHMREDPRRWERVEVE